MAKEWFQHDYGTRNKKKLAALIHEEGSKGYGLFWIIVEMLYEARSKKLEIDNSTFLALKKESGETIEYVHDFVERCLKVYKVFKKVGKSYFTTERVLENDKHRREISKKNSVNGIKSAQSRKKVATNRQQGVNDASTKFNDCPTEERRGEESTVEKNKERENTGEIQKIEPSPPPPVVVGPAHDLSKSNLFKQPKIPGKRELLETFIRHGGTKEMAKSFWLKYEGTGWFVNGSPMDNYTALAQRFIQNWKDNDAKKGKPDAGQPTKTYEKLN